MAETRNNPLNAKYCRFIIKKEADITISASFFVKRITLSNRHL